MKKVASTIAALACVAAFSGRASAQAYDQKYFTLDESSAMTVELTDRGGTVTPGDPPQGPRPGSPGGPQLPVPPTGPVINPPATTNTGGPVINPGGPVAPGGPTTPMQQWQNGMTQFNGTIDAIDKVVNLMEKIWGIIEKNQPVVNITTNYANAVPFGTSHWTQLQGWTRPQTKRYRFSMKNGFGSEVVKVVYQVHYNYNGNFQGKGKFLTGVTIEPLNVETLWGYKVSLVSEVPDSTIANVGTHEDPIASMQLQLRWVVHTAIKDISSKAIYLVQGDGLLQEIGAPSAAGMQVDTQRKIDAVTTQIENARF